MQAEYAEKEEDVRSSYRAASDAEDQLVRMPLRSRQHHNFDDIRLPSQYTSAASSTLSASSACLRRPNGSPSCRSHSRRKSESATEERYTNNTPASDKVMCTRLRPAVTRGEQSVNSLIIVTLALGRGSMEATRASQPRTWEGGDYKKRQQRHGRSSDVESSKQGVYNYATSDMNVRYSL